MGVGILRVDNLHFGKNPFNQVQVVAHLFLPWFRVPVAQKLGYALIGTLSINTVVDVRGGTVLCMSVVTD